MSAGQPILQVRGLCKTRKQGRWWQPRFQTQVLDHVDLTLNAGSTLALVGESGAGKTTIALCITGLEKPDAGEIWFDGKNLLSLPCRQRRELCRSVQLIFQDSAEALNPGMSAAEIIEEPLLIQERCKKSSLRQRALRLMERVGLSPSLSTRGPNELSGGQRQRVAIARALILEPRLLILDEALSGLDLSMQGQIGNLLLELQRQQGLTYLCISHDHAFVFKFADAVAFIRRGRIESEVDPASVTPARWMTTYAGK